MPRMLSHSQAATRIHDLIDTENLFTTGRTGSMEATMMKDSHWKGLTLFESHDYVRRWYKNAHGKDPNAAKVKQINACFNQARQYFANAATADLSVRPLLLYYGVLSFGRGVILANNPKKNEEALKPQHGLETVDWQHTLSDGIDNILELQIRAVGGTFPELAETCWNLVTMRKFQGPTNTMGSDALNLGEISFASDKTCLRLDDLVSRLPQLGVYQVVTGRPAKVFIGCRIASHPPGTHFAFPLIGIPPELKDLEDGEKVIIGSSNQVAPGLGQSDDAGDTLIFVHESHADYEKAKELFPVSYYSEGEYMSVILDFPNGDRMTDFFKLYLISYHLGMLARYFPSVWISLLRNERGDFAQPILFAAVEEIETDFPKQVLNQLTGIPKKLS